jgi:2-iminobutanoate/2-iminopropanoate deaminase
MKKKRINHPSITSPSVHVSAGVLFGDWIHVSGQGPLDMAERRIVPGTIEEETLRTLQNIESILGEAGAARGDVVKCTCYLSDLSFFPGFDQTYREFFQSPLPPARTTVQAGLLGGIKIEIDAIARVQQ